MIKLSYLQILLATLAAPLYAQADKSGTSDHALLSRYPGFYIEAATETDYDQARMIASAMVSSKVSLMTVEGQSSNIRYVSEDDTASAFQIISNYKNALDTLDAEIVFYCSNATECGGEGWQYGLETRDLDLFFDGLDVFFFEKFGIVVAKVEQGEQTAHVMVLATALEGGKTRRVFQTIVTRTELEADKIGVGSIEDVAADIAETGTVVLEGVLFDFDTANLTDTSNETLETVTQYLTAHPEQRFYVVGHTDAVGAHDYNVMLSQNRARSVVAALALREVSAERLTDVGVGPVAPVATNGSDAGRALNRRVEMVLRP
jgi:outer membrane protein OmpA-like peptidoglycan-associated protein